MPQTKSIDTKTIVVAAITIALTFALARLPIVFMLPLLFTASTRGMKMSLFMGLTFGIVSYLYSLSGGSIIAVAFVEAPWIPILPRIAVAFCANGVFTLSKRLIKGNSHKAIFAPYVLSAATGALTNTILVVSCLVLFKNSLTFGDMTIRAFVPIMLIYGTIELIVYSIVVPPLSLTVSKALGLSSQPRINQPNLNQNEEL